MCMLPVPFYHLARSADDLYHSYTYISIKWMIVVTKLVTSIVTKVGDNCDKNDC